MNGRCLHLFALIACCLATARAAELIFTDRIKLLSDYHGYYPCGDCHYNQETNRQPRILQDEHEQPMDWVDDAGAIHRVEFGERLPLADLLGKGSARGLRKANLARIGSRMNLPGFMIANRLSEKDSVWVLTHGGANIWCLDCHSADHRDKLVKLNGEMVSFNESFRICGQCHGPTLRDWEAGTHGRTNGYWNREMDKEGLSQRQLCVECHNPHAPDFRGMSPLAGPVTRLKSLPHKETKASHEDIHKGERDDLGPHPWQATPGHGK